MTGVTGCRGFFIVMLEMKVTGVKELEAALNELPKAVRRAALRTAMARAGKPAVEAATANAQAYRLSGDYAESFTIKTTLSKRQRKLRGKKTHEMVQYIGSTSRLAHLIEFGTAPHVILPKRSKGTTARKSVLASTETVYGPVVVHPGTPGRAVLRRAWDATRDVVVTTLGKLLWEQIEKAKKRLAARGRRR